MSNLRAVVIAKFEAKLMQFEELGVESPGAWRENFLSEALGELAAGRYENAERALDDFEGNPSVPEVVGLNLPHEQLTVPEIRARLDALEKQELD